ncbi:MAG: hypothetical protein Q9164_000269 [Protoblastenia rupestris]
MFDIHLRSVKDRIFDPACSYVPQSVTPLQVTFTAFLSGLLSCYFASQKRVPLSLLFWFLNRMLDCLDGALARQRKSASDLGGFLDLLGDFIVYSSIPLAIAAGSNDSAPCWKAVASLEATFHINNFILFYIAAVAEKKQAKEPSQSKTKELTSIMMRPALIEGMESGVLFTAMLAFPLFITLWCWLMAGLVGVGIVQRSMWVIEALE